MGSATLGRGYRIWTGLRGASQSVSLVLDQISVTSFGAFSVSRKLRGAYSGAAFRVRRASDNAETDIGFSGTVVDTAALATFCSGTTGTLSALYDQSPAGRNATMATQSWQPRIYASGAVDKMPNGTTAMYYPTSGGNTGIATPTTGLGFTGDPALTVACSFTRHSNEDRLWMLGDQGAAGTHVVLDAEVSRGMFASNYGAGSGARQLSYTTTADVAHSMIFKKAAGAALSAWDVEESGSNLSQITITNGTQHCNLSSTARIVIGNDTFFADALNGWIAAWIGFQSLLSGSDLTALRTEMANYA